MEFAWIICSLALIVFLLFLKLNKKETNEESGEVIKVNNKGCSIAFYLFLAVLFDLFVYAYIKYRQSLV